MQKAKCEEMGIKNSRGEILDYFIYFYFPCIVWTFNHKQILSE